VNGLRLAKLAMIAKVGAGFGSRTSDGVAASATLIRLRRFRPYGCIMGARVGLCPALVVGLDAKPERSRFRRPPVKKCLIAGPASMAVPLTFGAPHEQRRDESPFSIRASPSAERQGETPVNFGDCRGWLTYGESRVAPNVLADEGLAPDGNAGQTNRRYRSGTNAARSLSSAKAISRSGLTRAPFCRCAGSA
jgi:hypothetical protein